MEEDCIFIILLTFFLRMKRVQFLDAPGGDPVTYDLVTKDGYRMFPFFTSVEDARTNFYHIPNKKCRDDDILLVSFVKTGTHWLWEMLTMVIRTQSTVTNDDKIQGMLEASTEEEHGVLPSPRILNTHVSFKYIPKEALERKLKCVLLCRNPKDLAVSFFNHLKGFTYYQYDGKFENFLSMFLRGHAGYGSYPKYLLEWQQAIMDNPNWLIHIVYYEDLHKNSSEEISKLCEYLGRSVDEDLLRKILQNCQFENLKKHKYENRSANRKEHQALTYKNNFDIFRKGQVGDWKNWFTVAQDEAFDKWWADSTKELSMFKFKYT